MVAEYDNNYTCELMHIMYEYPCISLTNIDFYLNFYKKVS